MADEMSDERIAEIEEAHFCNGVYRQGCNLCDDLEEVFTALRAARKRIEELERAEAALREIAGGLGDTIPLPDIMAMDAETFRHEMWKWCQSVARAALEEVE